MRHELFSSALDMGVRVASVILPAAPLIGQKLPVASSAENLVLVHWPCQARSQQLSMKLPETR
jgi:hypothetical protein